MQPDKKVGLSLGILLIGVTAAFFFRNDVPVGQAQAPELVDPEHLDQQIRRKSQTPYLPERADTIAKADTPEVRDVAVTDVLPPGSGLTQTVPAAPIPDPIRPVEDDPAGRVAPIPHPSANLDEVGDALSRVDPREQASSARAQRNAEPASGAAAPQFHVVAAKETLSGISQKYLGTSRRYREIYEANRDKLDSPDDIREGMKLRIPDGGTSSKKNPTAAQSDSDTSKKKPADAAATPPLDDKARPSFVRPKGSNGRLPGRRTSQNSGRLSQDPPPGLPVVESFNPDKARAVIASRPRDEDAEESEPDKDE